METLMSERIRRTRRAAEQDGRALLQMNGFFFENRSVFLAEHAKKEFRQ